MTCLLCKISGCSCLFASPQPGERDGFCLLCAGAPCADERKIEIEMLREMVTENAQ